MINGFHFSPGRSCLQCTATKRKCMLTKEGSKKSWRVFSRNAEGTGSQKKSEKGKGKDKESERKQKWDEKEEDEEYVEDGEVETESSWWSFVTARMVMMDLELNKLQSTWSLASESDSLYHSCIFLLWKLKWSIVVYVSLGFPSWYSCHSVSSLDLSSSPNNFEKACQGYSNWELLLRARTPLVPVPGLDPQLLL